MQDKVLSLIAEKIIKVRDWEKANLPIGQSTLAFDLFLLISYHTLQGTPLTLKQLFHSSEFSEAGIRKHLEKLLSEGCCVLEASGKDKRFKHIVAQPRMLELLGNYIEMLLSEINLPEALVYAPAGGLHSRRAQRDVNDL